MDEQLKTFYDSIQSLIDIDEETLNEEMMAQIEANLDERLSPAMIEQSINTIIRNFEDEGVDKKEAAAIVDSIKDVINEMIFGEGELSVNKRELVERVLKRVYHIFDESVNRFHNYSITLPMTLAEGAIEPTYAHETDAAADLYALEDVNVDAHTQGNKIRTGVNIQLPEGWLAMILPRSSIGAKTPLRLSNSVGLIDSGYRGELICLYDNIADYNYSINAGDRIAQLLVMPSYRFKAQIVDSLEDSDRGTGGFGSTGV